MAELPFAILNEDGSCPEEYRELIDDDDLLRVLETFTLNRVIDRRFMTLQRQGRLSFYMLWRQIPLPLLLNQMIGNSQDLCKGRQMPVHYCYADFGVPSVSSPVGTQLPQACGFAYAARIQKTEQVALAFLGEGTASQGDFHTAVNFAGVFNAPAVFVIRNNGYAISTPESIQTAATNLASRGEGYGVPGFQVDGNDFLAVINMVGEAVERARRGDGPTLIEALTYRMGAHSTADDPSAYRSDEETERWERLDPQARLQRHARWRGIWNEELETENESEAGLITGR